MFFPRYCHYLHKTRKLTFPAANGLILALLVIFNFGLLIVDRILINHTIM